MAPIQFLLNISRTTSAKTIKLSDFYFLPIGYQKNINMLFLDFIRYHGNHFVESTLTKIIKITKLCNFYSHLYYFIASFP